MSVIRSITSFLAFLCYALFFGLATLVLPLLAFVVGNMPSHFMGLMARKIGVVWAKIAIRSTFSRIIFHNRNKIISKGSLYVVNHQAFVDIFLVLGYLKKDFLFLSKKEVFDSPFVGWAMKGARYLSLNREIPREAAKTTLDTIKKAKEGYNILIFPEGTYSENPFEMLEFKGGVAAIAQKSKAPIVPIVLYGTKRLIDPNKSFFKLKPTKLHIGVLDPILATDPKHPCNIKDKKQTVQFLDDLKNDMQQEHNRLAKLSPKHKLYHEEFKLSV